MCSRLCGWCGGEGGEVGCWVMAGVVRCCGSGVPKGLLYGSDLEGGCDGRHAIHRAACVPAFFKLSKDRRRAMTREFLSRLPCYLACQDAKRPEAPPALAGLICARKRTHDKLNPRAADSGVCCSLMATSLARHATRCRVAPRPGALLERAHGHAADPHLPIGSSRLGLCPWAGAAAPHLRTAAATAGMSTSPGAHEHGMRALIEVRLSYYTGLLA